MSTFFFFFYMSPTLHLNQDESRDSLVRICPDTISQCEQPCRGKYPIHMVSHSFHAWLTNPGKPY